MLPICLCVAIIVCVSDTIIKQNDLLFHFIGPSGKHHVNKTVLLQEIESGGLKMPEVVPMLKAVKLGWLKRFCTKQSIETLLHHQSLVDDIYSLTIYKCDVKNLDGVPNFYRQLFHF